MRVELVMLFAGSARRDVGRVHVPWGGAVTAVGFSPTRVGYELTV